MRSYADRRRRWTNRDSCIERECGRLAILNMLTVRVVDLEYRQLHKRAYNLVVCEVGGFESVLCDVGIPITFTDVMIMCATLPQSTKLHTCKRHSTFT